MEGPVHNGEHRYSRFLLDDRMERINKVLGTCGVEAIPKGRDERSPEIVYCNTGDTYGTTILYVNGRFRIGNWGSFVENGNYD